MKPSVIVRSTAAAGIITAAAVGWSASSAFAAAQTGSAAGVPFDLGSSSTGLPANCPFPNGDANFVFLSGSMVQHDTTNANGDWGGMTIEGVAQFYEGTTPLYQGHLTIWEGGGNNAKAQTEGGLTLAFESGGGGALRIHVDFHSTTNAQGTPTAGQLNVQVSCG